MIESCIVEEFEYRVKFIDNENEIKERYFVTLDEARKCKFNKIGIIDKLSNLFYVVNYANDLKKKIFDNEEDAEYFSFYNNGKVFERKKPCSLI
jgi:hypothetical protein